MKKYFYQKTVVITGITMIWGSILSISPGLSWHMKFYLWAKGICGFINTLYMATETPGLYFLVCFPLLVINLFFILYPYAKTGVNITATSVSFSVWYLWGLIFATIPI